MPPPGTAQVVTAPSTPVPVVPTSTRDTCPECSADLGRPRGATRRRIVFSAVPGEFLWQCPDCATVWSQRS